MDYKRAAHDLWQMLDYIDTYSDIAEGNDKIFRQAVEKKVLERHEILKTDGYDLFSPEDWALRCQIAKEVEQRLGTLRPYKGLTHDGWYNYQNLAITHYDKWKDLDTE